MSDYSPLVSIVVITYNSCNYVLETLESAKMQTYQNIELIITDDGSTDETVKVCRNWLEKNQSRFVRAELLTVSENTGIPANCNRGYKAARGEWIKGIAGDDALLPDCVKDYMDFVQDRPEIEICHSAVRKYLNSLEEEYFLGVFYPRRKFTSSSLSSRQQFNLLKFGSCICAPSVFMKKALVERVGYYDEELKLCEDWPMWLKITKCGYKFYYLAKSTVKYRTNAQSVTARKNKKYIPHDFYIRYCYVYTHFLMNDTSFLLKWRMRYRINLYLFLEKHHLNDRKFINTIIFHLIDWPIIALGLEYFYTMGVKGFLEYGYDGLIRKWRKLFYKFNN